MDCFYFIKGEDKIIGEPLKNPQSVILASASPRRRELMPKIIDKYEIKVADVEEILPKNISALKAPEYLARLKAMAVSKDNRGRIVIGCDTVVIINDKILGKPENEEDAKRMLRLLSGKTHLVVSGVCITNYYKTDTFACISEVTFKNLTDSQIEEYLQSGESMDKAGAYGIQGKAGQFVESVNGSVYNVIGFPILQIKEHLPLFFIKKD